MTRATFFAEWPLAYKLYSRALDCFAAELLQQDCVWLACPHQIHSQETAANA